MNNEYKVGRQGGMARIAMPLDCTGNTYRRTIWKDGTVVFREVEE